MGQRLRGVLTLLILLGPTAALNSRDLPQIWDPDTDDPKSDDPKSDDPKSDTSAPLFLSSRGFAPPHSDDPIKATSDPINADPPSPHKLGSFPTLKDDNGDEELKVEFLPVDLGSKGKKKGKRGTGPIGVDPIRVKVGPTDPIRVKVGPTDPIRVKVGPTDPIRVKVGPIDPIRVKDDLLANVDPIRVGVNSTDPIRIGIDPTDPIRVGVDPIDPIRVGVGPTDPIMAKADPLTNVDPIRVGVDPSDPIRVEVGPIDPIKVGVGPIDPIRVGVDPIDPIMAKADPLTNVDPIRVGVDPSDPIRVGVDPIDPIDPIRAKADPLTNADPIRVGVDPTDPIKFGIDPTDPIRVKPSAKVYPIVTVAHFGVAGLLGDPDLLGDPSLLGDPNLLGDVSGSGDSDLPTTAVTTPNPTTPNQGPCQNNGVQIDGVCHCTPLFYGVECQYGKESVEVTDATMAATVTMSAKVLNRAFSPALENPKSPEFAQFRQEFTQKMEELYGNLEGFEGVEILALREGSVVVTYEVLLRVGAGIGATSVVEDLAEDLLRATVADCSQCSDVTCEMCFNASSTVVTNHSIEALDEALCLQLVPPSLIGYYTPVLSTNGVLCVTRCHPLSPEPLPCVHGACAVSGGGPQCDCSDPASFWYLDSSCSTRLSKLGLALGLPLAALCVAAAGCGAALLKARRQRRADRAKLVSRTALYGSNEEEEVWGGSAGFAATNRAAAWGEMEEPNRNYISLQSVGSAQVRIQRPQICVPPPEG